MRTITKLFLAYLAIFAISCGVNDKKRTASPCDSLEAKYKLKIITRLDDMKDADSAIFKAPNNKCFLVVADKTILEDEHSENLKSSVTPNKPYDSDLFDGTDRKDAKTSIANAYTLEYQNLTSFIKSLPGDDEMGKTHVPEISTDANSKRVDEEKKNVHIKQAWIYTFARQADEDYHVIIGDSPDLNKAIFFNIEISGLPDKSNASFAKLSKVRQSFKDFFGIKDSCKKGYTLAFINSPVEIEFSGSLFFDKFHYDHKSEIGYKNLKPKSYWEIHPISKIKFI
jgi:hypothetical protein